MTSDQFMQGLVSNGVPTDSLASKLAQFRSDGGEFDDDQSEQGLGSKVAGLVQSAVTGGDGFIPKAIDVAKTAGSKLMQGAAWLGQLGQPQVAKDFAASVAQPNAADSSAQDQTNPGNMLISGLSAGMGMPNLPPQLAHLAAGAEVNAATSPMTYAGGITKIPAVAAAVSKGGEIIPDAVSDLGSNIMRRAIDPSKKNLNAGFDVDNLSQNGVQGLTQKETLGKIEALHNDLNQQADQVVSQIPKVDLAAPINQARKTFQDAFSQGKLLDNKADITKALNTWENHALDLAATPENTATSAPDEFAVNGPVGRGFRSSLGSASAYDKANPASTTGSQMVAREIRDNLNDQFSQLSPEMRQIDQQFSQTIPIRNAIADNLKMEGNKYPLSFRSSLAMVSHATPGMKAAEIGAIELPRSFPFGSALNSTGNSMQNIPDYLLQASQSSPVLSAIAAAGHPALQGQQ